MFLAIFKFWTSTPPHDEINNSINYPLLTLVHPVYCQQIYSLEFAPLALEKWKILSQMEL